MKTIQLGILSLFVLSQSACSLFFGNIKPVEEKSTAYGIMDLSKNDTDWIRVDSQGSVDATDPKEPESTTTGISDMAFQSKRTASIISVNSACKSYNKGIKRDEDLKALTRELLLGISSVSLREEKEITVNGVPALQTTVRGKMNREDMMLRTVVLQKQNCVYDLMYVARPEKFQLQSETFGQFVGSLKLRDVK